MKQSEQDTDDLLPTNGRKPTYIKEQHNYNCQQFFGNISNCTFTMPPATPASSMQATASTPQRKKPTQKKTAVAASVKPMTIRYYKHGNNGLLQRQRHRWTFCTGSGRNGSGLTRAQGPKTLTAFSKDCHAIATSIGLAQAPRLPFCFRNS